MRARKPRESTRTAVKTCPAVATEFVIDMRYFHTHKGFIASDTRAFVIKFM